MATYTAKRIKHATLAPSVIDIVQLAFNSDGLEVLNRGTVSDIYFTVNSTVDPTLLGDDIWVVRPNQALQVSEYPNLGSAGLTVKLISAGATDYSVTGC